MHAHTVNYRDRDDGDRRGLLNKGFFLHGVPRLMILCRLFGHKPVVDGTEPIRQDSSGYIGSASRWVCCDRCGVRGEPQGHLDPQVWAIGDAYAGQWLDEPVEARELKLVRRNEERGYELPGPIKRRPTGALGGQVLVGAGYDWWGWELKVGNCGSEHTLAANFKLGRLFAIYLHTERHGTWLQRRLNPVGYESRIAGVEVRDGRLEWRLWTKRDSATRYGPNADPWWRNGELDLRVRDRLLGPKRYAYTDVAGGQITRIVRMPEGDYLVQLKLQRVAFGRRRGRKTMSWSVDWESLGGGIPTKASHRGRILGAGVDVSARAVSAGTWPAEAVAAITAAIAACRTREGWDPIGQVRVSEVAA